MDLPTPQTPGEPARVAAPNPKRKVAWAGRGLILGAAFALGLWTAMAGGSDPEFGTVSEPSSFGERLSGWFGNLGDGVQRLLGRDPLSVSLEPGRPSFVPGAPAGHVLEVRNQGSSALEGIEVEARLSPDLDAPGWTCVIDGAGHCRETRGSGSPVTRLDLGPGATARFQIDATLSPFTVAPVRSTVSISHPADSVTSNNTDTRTVAVGASAGIFLSEYPGRHLYGSGLDGTGLQPVSAASAGNYGVAVDTASGYLYWSSHTEGSLHRARLDGSGHAVVADGLVGPWAIAVDGVGGRLFWSEPAARRIQCMVINGGGPVETVAIALENPVGVAFDTNRRRLFFVEHGAGRIAAGVVGEGCAPLRDIRTVVSGLSEPYALALDADGGQVFWSEFAEGTIGVAALDGSAIERVLWSGLSGPADLAVDPRAGLLYWNEYNSRTTRRARMDGAGEVETLVRDRLSRPLGLALHLGGDVSVTADVEPAELAPLEAATFHFRVRNDGDERLRGVRLIAEVPEDLVDPRWSCAIDGLGRCHDVEARGPLHTGIDLAPGAEAVLVLEATVEATAAGPIAVPLAAIHPLDVDVGNNAATAEAGVGQRIDLRVSTQAVDPLVAGSVGRYRFEVVNHGPSHARGARFEHAIPAGLANAVWRCQSDGRGGVCEAWQGTGDVSTRFDLDAGSRLRFEVEATLPSGLLDLLELAARASHERDTGVSGGRAQASLAVEASTDLVVTVEAPDRVVAGLPLSYRVRAGNRGPSDARAATIEIPAVPGLGAPVWRCDTTGVGTRCPAVEGGGTIEAGIDIAAGGEVVFELEAEVPRNRFEPLRVRAVARHPADRAAGDNVAVLSRTPVAEVALSSELAVSDTLVAGQPARLLGRVRNDGPSDAVGVRVRMTLPEALAGAGWVCLADEPALCGTRSGVDAPDLVVDLPVGAVADLRIDRELPSSVTGSIEVGLAAEHPGDTTAAAAEARLESAVDRVAALDLDLEYLQPPVAGREASYRIVIGNSGPSDVDAVEVRHDLDNVFAGAAWTCEVLAGDARCRDASGQGPIRSGADIGRDGRIAYTVGRRLSPAAGGEVRQSATARHEIVDAGAEVRVEDREAVARQARLRVTRRVVSEMVAGLPLEYVIEVSNEGPSNVEGVRVQDALPRDLSGAEWRCSIAVGDGRCDERRGSGEIDESIDLTAGAAAHFTVTGSLASSVTGPLLSTTVAEHPDNVSPELSLIAVPFPVSVRADLSLAAAPVGDLVAGLPGRYRLSLGNRGPSDATAVEVVDPIAEVFEDAAWSCVTGTGAACEIAGGEGALATTVDLPAGSTVEFEISGSIPSARREPAPVAAAIHHPGDTTPGSSAVETAWPVSAQSDIVLAVNTDEAPVAGRDTWVRIAVRNDGPSDADGIELESILPEALRGATWVCAVDTGGGRCATPRGEGDLRMSLDLAAGSAASVVLSHRLDPSPTGTVDLPVRVRHPNDTTPERSAAVLESPVLARVDLAAGVEAAEPFVAGAAARYAVEIRNRGPSDARRAAVRIPAPDGIDAMAWACQVPAGGAQCTEDGGSGSVDTTVDIPAGGVVRFVIDGVPDAAREADVTLAAAVEHEHETDPANSQASAEVPLVLRTDIVAEIVAGRQLAGKESALAVVVHNAGPSDARDVALELALPDVLAAADWECEVREGAARCAPDAGTGSGTLSLDLPVGAAVRIGLRQMLPSDLVDPLEIVAVASHPRAAVAERGRAALSVAVERESDLAIVQAADEPWVAGREGRLRARITNDRPSDARGIRLDAVVDPALAIAGWTCEIVAGAGACPAAEGPWPPDPDGFDLAAGAEAAWVLDVDVPSSLERAVTVGLRIEHDQDRTPERSQAESAVTPGREVELVTRAFPEGRYVAGRVAAMRATVENRGPSDARGVRVAFEPELDSPTRWSCRVFGDDRCDPEEGGAADVAIVDLAAGARAEFELAVDLDPSAIDRAGVSVIVRHGAPDDAEPDSVARAESDVVRESDLSVTVNAVEDPVAGRPARFQIDVRNAGPSDADDVRLRVPLQGALTAARWRCEPLEGNPPCAVGEGLGSIDAGLAVGAGRGVRFELTAGLNPALRGELAFQATIEHAFDITPANNVALAGNPIGLRGDIELEARAVQPLVAGAEAEISVRLRNRGPSDLEGVIARLDAPDGLLDPAWSCVADVGPASCALALGLGGMEQRLDLPAGTAVELSLFGSMPSSRREALRIEAEVEHDGLSGPAPARVSRAFDVELQGDLYIEQQVSAAWVPGRDARWRLAVGNRGPSDLEGVSVALPLPAGLEAARWECVVARGEGACGSRTGTGALRETVDLAAGARIEYTLVAPLSSSLVDTLAMTAEVEHERHVGSGASTHFLSVVPEPSSDLAARVEAPEQYVAGAAGAYALEVENRGPSDAIGVQIRGGADRFFAAATWICRGDADAARCRERVGEGEVDVVADIPSGTRVRVEVAAAVPSSTDGAVAHAVNATLEGQPGADSLLEVPVRARTELEIFQAHAARIVAGQPATITARVVNHGPSDARGIAVSSSLPDALAGAFWRCGVTDGSGACNEPSGTGDLDTRLDLAAGAEATFTFVAAMSPAAREEVIHTVSATHAADRRGGAVRHEARIPVDVETNLSVTKTHPESFIAGLPATFVINVRNEGPSDAVGVTVIDNLPAAFTDAEFTCVVTRGRGRCEREAGIAELGLNETIDLARGAEVEIQVTKRLSETFRGTLVNVVTIDHPDDTTPELNTASDEAPIQVVAEEEPVLESTMR